MSIIKLSYILEEKKVLVNIAQTLLGCPIPRLDCECSDCLTAGYLRKCVESKQVLMQCDAMWLEKSKLVNSNSY